LKYNVISGDSHVDMSWLPGDLFVKNCSKPKLRDLMPRIVETKDGLRWIAEKDNVLGVAQSAGFEFIKPQPGRWRRTDKMLAAGFYDGPARPVDPELRLKDMMTDGVDCEILYGITGAGKNLHQDDVIAEVYRTYTDWANEFAGSYPGRWYVLAPLPFHDGKLAAAEARRASKLKYVRGFDLMASQCKHPIYARDGYWDELWEVVNDTGLSISSHLGGGRIPVQDPPGGSTAFVIEGRKANQNEIAWRGVMGALGQLSGVQYMCAFLMNGACQKYENFKFVMGEAGTGWIPFILNRLDHAYSEQYFERIVKNPPMPEPPSYYWARQGYTTFQEEPSAGQLAHLVGINNVMWGSDYPHPDSTWPDSQEVIHEALGNLKPADLKKVLRDNAIKLYNVGK